MHCNVHTANAYAPLTNTMQGRSNTRDLLQGITTNDCAPLERKGAPPRYAALLNSQGRVLHDMHLHRTRAPARRRSTCAWRTFRNILWLTSCRFAGDEAPVVFADVDKEGMPDLIKLLRR